jgi:hypothetical protein
MVKIQTVGLSNKKTVRHPEKIGKPDSLIKKKTKLDQGESTKFESLL